MSHVTSGQVRLGAGVNGEGSRQLETIQGAALVQSAPRGRLESHLKHPMQTFHESVGLQMVCECDVMLNSQYGSHLGPQGQSKLLPSVAGDVAWYTKSGDPERHQSTGADSHCSR